MSENLKKIYELMDGIKADDENAAKAARRRQRVALNDVAKLCKLARKDLLEAMKGD